MLLQPRMNKPSLLLFVGLWFVLAHPPPLGTLRAEVVESDWGPFYSRVEDLSGRKHLNILGPFFQHTTASNQVEATALRPFWAELSSPREALHRQEFLFPLGHLTDFGRERKFRFLTAIGWNFDRMDPESSWKFWIFPFWYQGKSRSGQTYAALWPLGGVIRDFAWQDEITFACWPLWSRNRIKDLKTTSILWPLYSHSVGPDKERRRIFPFYGYSRVQGREERRFILWPFWTDARVTHANGQESSGFMFFPFYGESRSGERLTQWFIPPFFRVSNDPEDRIEYALWPIFQRRKGEEAQKLYIWPLWGRSIRGDVERGFVLWPMYRTSRVERATYTYVRKFLLPFLYVHSREPKPVEEIHPGQEHPEVPEKYVEIWPVFSWERREGFTTFRMLDLWPGRDSEVVLRNWSPIWTPIKHVSHEKGADTELLWGLFRRNVRGDEYSHLSLFPVFEKTRDSGASTSKWQIGKGLLGVEKSGEHRQVRVLWFLTFGKGGNSK